MRTCQIYKEHASAKSAASQVKGTAKRKGKGGKAADAKLEMCFPFPFSLFLPFFFSSPSGGGVGGAAPLFS
jgi:hypothetical protein